MSTTNRVSPTSENIDNGEKRESMAPTEAATVEDDSRYLTGSRLFLPFVGMLMSILLVALDQTIVATALPVIASKFNAFNQVTWIATGYFLTQGGLMLTYGQLLSIASTKWVYLTAVILFEIGSLFCAVAPNMEFLIFGRAVAGAGGAGIFVAVLSIIAQVTRLEQRPVLFGSFGAVFALSSVVGPLLGGAFTDHVSWRWCFYINLPFGAITVWTIIFLIPKRDALAGAQYQGKTTVQKWLSLDWFGSALALATITSLLLPLQWGGNERAWDDRVVIALRGDRAVLRTAMFRRRTQVGTCIESFFISLALLIGTYYLPAFFQVTKGHSATRSGIDILPYMLSVVFSAAGSGGTINFTGRYWPFLLCSPLLISVGSGLLYTLDGNSGTGKEIGYQIIYGIGVGGALQNTVIAIQAEYAKEEELIPQGTSLVTFTQLVGGIIGIAIAGTILANELTKYLALYAPDLPHDIGTVVRRNVAAIFELPPEQQGPVIHAYLKALNRVFLIGVPAGGLASLSALLVKNYNLKTRGLKLGGAGAS
ncbi:Major facilitator (MFS1) transporter-like protein [Ceratobasidium theobromae]|uniref:Major facilitator (MFS1) transporter-like protein n=1 Tax=Ceratobasidium theobromae TaxID=1582974 RepID=A0A5N5QJ32_9AGAM|nr:Major facilitator (MFS1) transporter-like protein [Ceratobasidium theobromae]